MKSEKIPEGAMWRALAKTDYCYYKTVGEKAFSWSVDDQKWLGIVGGVKPRAEFFDGHVDCERIATPVLGDKWAQIATVHDSLVVAAAAETPKPAAQDFVRASDAKGIALPKPPEPTPAPTFYAPRKPNDGLLTLAPFGGR